MVLLRRPSPEVSTSADKVIDTLDKSGLEKETLLVLGGGALALAGIRPAHDVDIMIPHSKYRPIAYALQTPAGLELRHQQGTTQAFLTTPKKLLPASMLTLDITHPHGFDNRPSPEIDEELIERLQQFDDIDGYHFLPPRLVSEHKKTVGRRKDRHDIKLIRKFLEEQEQELFGS